MKNIADIVHIGELIAVSKVFHLNPYKMVTLIENGLIEVFVNKEAFSDKYGDSETFDELDWCELNNGKIFLKSRKVTK